MKEKSKVLGIIPARGGSKTIPKKNLALFAGKPLIQYTITAAKESELLSRVILSSDSPDIMAYCQQQGIEVPFTRPEEWGRDDTPMIDVIRHAVGFLEESEAYVPDIILILQPTSPLRTACHIDEALKLLCDADADSVVSVVKVPHQFNPYSVMKLEGGHLLPFLQYDERKNLKELKPVFYGRNGPAICAFTYKCLIEKQSLFGDKILPYFMKKEESVDIDDALDLLFAEAILKLNIEN